MNAVVGKFLTFLLNNPPPNLGLIVSELLAIFLQDTLRNYG